VNQRIKQKLANRAANRGHAIGREHNALKGKKMHHYRIKMHFTRVAIQIRESMKLALAGMCKAVAGLVPAINAVAAASQRYPAQSPQKLLEDHVKDRIINSVVMNAVMNASGAKAAMHQAIAALTEST
jgi:hypothetical protein